MPAIGSSCLAFVCRLVGDVFIPFGLERPAGRHDLFHQQGSRNGLQKVVDGHRDIFLCGVGARYQVDELRMRLALTVARTASYNLHDFGQRRTYADGDTAFAPRPVETFLGRAERYQNVECVARIHALQVGLKGIPAQRIVLYQVAHLQDTPVGGLYMVDVVFVVRFYNLAYTADDVGRLVVLRCISRFGVHIGDVYQCLFRCIERFGQSRDILACKELVADAQTLQVLVSAELLVVVVVDGGLEPGFVFGPHHRNGIPTKITARHGQYVCRRFVEQSAYQFAQIIIGIGRGVMEFVDAKEYLVQPLVGNIL